MTSYALAGHRLDPHDGVAGMAEPVSRRSTMRIVRSAGIGLAAVVALSGGVATAQEPVTVTYLTHWVPDWVAQLEEAATAFEAQNPDVDVEIRAVPFGDLLTTLKTQAASPGGPTAAGIYNLWLPELARDGIAAPAPEEFLADITANWPASAVDGASVDDVNYGYPNEINTYALNYNKRLFEEAGIDAPPATWDELIDAAQKLTKKDGDLITQQGFGLINSWPAGVVHPFYSMVASDGGDIVDGTTPTMDSGATAEVMALYERLVGELGVTAPEMGQADANTRGPFMDNFANGSTAMMIMANWWQGSLKDAMGDSYADVATAPIPVGPGGDASRPVSYEWLTMVNGQATPEQQDAAWRFLQFINSPESGATASAMGDILMSNGIIPSRTSDIDAYSTVLTGDPFLKTYVDSLATAVPFPMILGGQELSEMIQKKLEAIEFGEMSAADAAAQAQAEATQILSQYYE
jgi:ABC-type glycerol-3-phosphate transport system substrate-binding protein